MLSRMPSGGFFAVHLLNFQPETCERLPTGFFVPMTPDSVPIVILRLSKYTEEG